MAPHGTGTTGRPALPRRLGHIWIGPKPAPVAWMETWPKLHPNWSYTVYGNDTLTGFPFRLRALINEYAWRGAWAGAQDMMRYELLYHYGGFMADADAICLHPVDELLDRPRAYTVYDRPETSRFRGVCPILACEPGNPFVGRVIDELAKVQPWELGRPETTTGNRFLMRLIRTLAPDEAALKIFPTHYFIPWQKSAPDEWYSGPDRIYAEQKWGTSMWSYNRAGGPSGDVLTSEQLAERHAVLTDRLAGAFGDRHGPVPTDVPPRLDAVRSRGTELPKLLARPEVRQDTLALNTALCDGMVRRQRPVRFQGMHFYRHMQSHPLTESPLRSRSDQMRRKLVGWLGTARNALVFGYDTGHLILSALHLNPDLRITATDAGRWPIETDTNPPERGKYVPIACDWLADRFAGRLTISAQPEPAFLAGPAREAAPAEGFDLVLFADADWQALRSLMLARSLLQTGAFIVAASAQGTGGRRFGDRLRLQNLCDRDIETADFGAGTGSLSVVRWSGGTD